MDFYDTIYNEQELLGTLKNDLAEDLMLWLCSLGREERKQVTFPGKWRKT
jgi:hypothetical protein